MKPLFDTKSFIACYLAVVAPLLLFYILYRWGQEKEILTLIIGLLSTIVGGLLGYYFGSSIDKKHPPIGASSAEISATITTDTATNENDAR